MISNIYSDSLEKHSPINSSSYKELLHFVDQAIEDMGISDKWKESGSLRKFSDKLQTISGEKNLVDDFKFPFLGDISEHKYFKVFEFEILNDEIRTSLLSDKIEQLLEKLPTLLYEVSKRKGRLNESYLCAFKTFIKGDGLNFRPVLKLYLSSVVKLNPNTLLSEFKNLLESTEVNFNLNTSQIELVQAETELWNILNPYHIMDLENIIFHQQNKRRCKQTKNESLISLAEMHDQFDFISTWKYYNDELPF